MVSQADTDVFEAVRPRLFGIAYRMLGTRHEAEEIVQEAWLRWQGTDRGAVREPAAFLATATTRLAINEAQSARARRETYIGPWLPEPVDTGADPLLGAVTGEALELVQKPDEVRAVDLPRAVAATALAPRARAGTTPRRGSRTASASRAWSRASSPPS